MKRDQFSRNSSFLIHLLLATVSTATAFMIVAGLIIFAPAAVRLEFGSGALDEVAILAQKILDIHAVVWPVVASCLITVILSSLFLFNRMTEPLSRFVKIFESIGKGRIPDPIRLRRRDYLHREAKSLNEMTARLYTLIAEIKRSQSALSSTIDEIAEVMSRNDPDRLVELVNLLGEQEKSLRESASRFSGTV